MHVLPYALLAFGLLATFALWWSARQSIDTKEQLEFQRRLDQAHTLVERRIEEHVTLLRATAAAIAIEPELTQAEFRTFTETLGLSAHYPGVLGVGYAYRVPHEQLAPFEARMRQENLPTFTIHPRIPSGDQYPIRYLEPLIRRNQRAVGYDMYSEPIRRKAMALATDTGEPAITSKVVLVQDKEVTNEPGFLFYVPIYETGEVPSSVAERRAKILGFAYSPIRTQEFFQTLFDRRGAPDIGVEIDSGEANGDKSRLFYYAPRSFGDRAVIHDQPDALDIAGVHISFRYFAPSYASEMTGTELLPWVPLAGVLISLLMFGIARSQVAENQRAYREAMLATRSAQRERFLSEVGKVLAASLDYRTTLDQVAALAVPDFAEWAAVDVPGPDGAPERLSVRHVDPSKVEYAVELAKRYPSDPNASFGIAHVMRTGKPEYMHRIPANLLDAAIDADHRRIIEELDFKSYICVPMVIRGETVGVITFVSTDKNKLYDEDDFKLAQEIAARAAVAVDNARLYEAAQREIDERKRVEQQIRDLNANLERSVDERTKELRASNNELEAFCYSVSHDLRTPLRSVDGFSKALIEDYGDRLPEDGIAYLDRVRKASHRMDELITALLTLSRITRTEILRQEVDLSLIAQAAVNEITRDLPEDKVKVAIQPDMVAKADSRMVRVIYDNLISNAIKFSSTREVQEIEIGRKDGVFFVRDNGVGFNPEYRAKLFAPFERLHNTREFPGTGIGLATVQRVIHRHGGEIWAESDLGHGATFYFTLA